MISWVRNYNHWIREDEILDQLSFHTWKTRMFILEEILAKRQKEGEDAPDPKSFRLRTRATILLATLEEAGQVEIRKESELRDTNPIFIAKSPSDDRRSELMRQGQMSELLFYKLKAATGKPKKDKWADLKNRLALQGAD